MPQDPTTASVTGNSPAFNRNNYWLLFAGVMGVYVAAEATGLVFAFRPALSFVHPAFGIALAAVLIFGYPALPGIVVGAFIAHGLILQSLAETLELGFLDVVLATLGLCVAESIEAAAALWLLRRAGFWRGLVSVNDVVKFVIFAALISTFIGAGIGTSTLFLTGVVDRELLGRAMIALWFGNAIAALAITPFLLTWRDRRIETNQHWEALCLGLLLVLACQVAFGKWLDLNQTSFPLAFLPFPLVMWAALRFRGFGAAVASAFTTIAGVFTVLRTQRLLDWESAFEPTLIQYAFSGAICVTAMLIAASQEERRRAEESRRQRESEIRSLLSAIPDALLVLDAAGRYRQVFSANQDSIVDTPEELIGKTLHEVLPKEPADIGMRVIEKVIATREPVDTNYPLTVHGTTKRFTARVVPYGTATDPLVLWVARDISDLHQTQARLRADEALLRNLLELQEDERKLLSYELHDGIVQYMVGAHMTLEGVAGDLTPSQAASRDSLVWSRNLIRKSIDELRSLISELRPLIIDESGVVESIGYLINDELANKFKMRFIPMVENDRLPPLLEATVFRIVQELLANIRKHSQAKNVQIKLVQANSTLQISVEDDGIGFDIHDETKNHFGVEQVTKRVELFGGSMSIDSSPNGGGTRIEIVLPLEIPMDVDLDKATLSPLRDDSLVTPTAIHTTLNLDGRSVTPALKNAVPDQDSSPTSVGDDSAENLASQDVDTPPVNPKVPSK